MSNPNILWLSLESVRADHTSLYGYDRPTTPFLERLARRSDAVAIDPLIAASLWTPASTASLLTGTHLSTHQVGQDGKAEHPLPASIETLPELLSGTGYQTALFSTNPYIGEETGLNRGFDYTETVAMQRSNYTSVNSVTYDTIRTALRRLRNSRTLSPASVKRELASAQNDLLEYRMSRWFTQNATQTQPFFTYAHVPSPHHPYQPVGRLLDRVAPERERSVSEALTQVNEIYASTDAIYRQMAEGLDFSERTWERIQLLYDAEIRYADNTVRNIVNKATEVSDRPLLIVVVGDHGDLFGEHGLIGHNLVLHDGVTRVPGLVVGIDDVTDPDDAVTQHIDLTYTVAKITGVLTDQFQGRDIRETDRPYAISQRGTAHLDAYTKHNASWDTSRFFEAPFSAVRTPEYKLLSNESRTALYRLPDEERDVAETRSEIVSELRTYLEHEEIAWSASQEEQIDYDASTAARLRDLGYLQ
jgi:uncharacterized sulfatase